MLAQRAPAYTREYAQTLSARLRLAASSFLPPSDELDVAWTIGAIGCTLLGLDVCELATQFRYPMSAEIARWPSVDAFVANRHMVPILFAQVMILSLALVLGCADDPRAGGGVRPSRAKSG